MLSRKEGKANSLLSPAFVLYQNNNVICFYIVNKLLAHSWFVTEQRQIGNQAKEELLLIWHNAHIHMHPSVLPSLVFVILVLLPSVSGRSSLIE